MKGVGKFTAVWNILWPFRTYMYGYFGIFFPFWYVAPRKIWQPLFCLPTIAESIPHGEVLVAVELFATKSST
jgi:hypothetical protein